MPAKFRPPPLLLAILLIGIAGLLAGCSGQSQALWNVLEYRLRRAWPPLIVVHDGASSTPGSLAGTVRDSRGAPIPGAVALVSSVQGQVYQDRSDTGGRYRIDGVPPGRYVPLAGAWGYQEQSGQPVQVLPGGIVQPVDFTLPPYEPLPVVPTNLRLGPPQVATSDFPEPLIATRFPFTFTLDGLTIDTGQVYLPAQAAPQGVLVIVYPSQPLNWNAASVALTRDGFAVLAVGPDGDRGLDIEGHVRDFRATLQLWRGGELEPLAAEEDRYVLMSGSFGSLILFRALRDLPGPPAIVDVGGVGDAFLGVQSLYSEDLAIPPPYDSAVAAMGRPDRDPAFFFAYSPVFFAEHLPPMFVIHTYNDEVIPYNQALALEAALGEANVPRELLLYEDTTHYLDAYRPTEATYMVYERVMAFVGEVLGGS